MLYPNIPKDIRRLQRSIQALEWQLTQDVMEEDRNIHMQTLEQYKRALDGKVKVSEPIRITDLKTTED